MLMPMCDVEINEHQQLQNGKTMANATVVKQKNPIEIMKKRIEEISSMIVQYGGQEKLEELRAKVQAIKSQYEKGSQFSEQESSKEISMKDVVKNATSNGIATEQVAQMDRVQNTLSNERNIEGVIKDE